MSSFRKALMPTQTPFDDSRRKTPSSKSNVSSNGLTILAGVGTINLTTPLINSGVTLAENGTFFNLFPFRFLKGLK
jgi:hypothetical protein